MVSPLCARGKQTAGHRGSNPADHWCRNIYRLGWLLLSTEYPYSSIPLLHGHKPDGQVCSLTWYIQSGNFRAGGKWKGVKWRSLQSSGAACGEHLSSCWGCELTAAQAGEAGSLPHPTQVNQCSQHTKPTWCYVSWDKACALGSLTKYW